MRLRITNISRFSSTDREMCRFPFNSLTISEKGRLQSMWFSELSDTRVFIFVQLCVQNTRFFTRQWVSAGEVVIHYRFLHGKLMESKCFPSVHRTLNARRICTTFVLTATKLQKYASFLAEISSLCFLFSGLWLSKIGLFSRHLVLFLFCFIKPTQLRF